MFSFSLARGKSLRTSANFVVFSDTLGHENTAFQRIKSTRYRPFIQGRRMFLRGR